MARYMVERTLADGGAIPASAERASACLGSGNHDADVGVTWLHSYVSEDRTKSFCLYEGPDPEAIRRAAGRGQLSIASITRVRVLDPCSYP
jgi:hypothetical protein